MDTSERTRRDVLARGGWLLAACAGLGSTGCASKFDGYGYITPGPDTWYKRDVEGFQYAAERAGVNVVVYNSEYNAGKEIGNIESLIDQGVKGMCVFTFNQNGAQTAAEMCAEADIPLVVTDNAGKVLEHTKKVVACIDFDWKKIGETTATWITRNCPGENIAMIMGRFEHVPVQQFREAFEPAVKKKGHKIVEVRDAKYDPKEAAKLATDMVSSDLDFSVLYVFNEDMAAAVVRVLESEGKLNNPIKVVSENGSPVGIDLVRRGALQYSISSSPGWEGMVSFLALHAHVTGKDKATGQQIMLPVTPLTKATVDDKTKVVPWSADPVWLKLTKEHFPQYDGLY